MATLDVALLILRFGVGLIFAVHGAQKMFGLWNGPGFAGWTAAMDRMGYRPAVVFAGVSATAELAGGLLLAIGLFTPLAAFLLVAQSVVIIGAAHWRSGFFNKDNGFEFPLALVTGVVAVLFAGPGALSLDAAVGFVLTPEVRSALFVLAIAGGLATLAVPALTARRTGPQGGVPQAH
jgi:putative oxidoreductase